MPKGVLDNPASLGALMRGPIADLMEKLASRDGEFWERNLKLLLRGELVEKEFGSEEEFDLEVDYDLAFPQAIEAGGFDWKHPCIAPEHRLDVLNFRGKHQRKLVLVHFDREMLTKDVKREGLRWPTIEEGSAFAAKYPELQLKFPIVILGSRFRGDGGFECAPSLFRSGGRRSLILSRVDGRWIDFFRFLFVREVSPPKAD